MKGTGKDRLRALIDGIVESLDEPKDGAGLADKAFLSRFHFQRIIKAAIQESPGRFRRRLLLERAAFQLLRTTLPVTEIAFDAGYETLEAFIRAFGRAYSMSPTQFRNAGGDLFRLDAANGIHFHPPVALSCRDPHVKALDGPHAPVTGENTMDLTERQIQHDQWLTHRLIESAKALSDEQLDRSLRPKNAPIDFECPPTEDSLRLVLTRMVATKEAWVMAIEGRELKWETDKTIDSLAARHQKAGTEFCSIVRRARDANDWDAAFVDALCDPPVSFTLGSVVAHVLTFGAQRRSMAISMLRELGIDEVGYGDPIVWEQDELMKV